MPIPAVQLAPAREKTLSRRHPWIFSGALQGATDHLENGDVVQVRRKNGSIIGIGHFQHASIAVRMLSWVDVEIDSAFWQQRLANASQLRNRIGLPSDQTNAYRLVCGEGDFLPGLIVDVYGTVAVLQAHSDGMYRARQEIAAAILATVPQVDAVIDRSKDRAVEWIAGAGSDSGLICENNHQFDVNWTTGQKTGFFLDQRNNRALLAAYASGRTVLNAFCYTGGFSVYAAKAGAKRVVSVDSSTKALDLVRQNLQLNQLKEEDHPVVKADCLKYLQNLPEAFDLIVLDPPAFAKSAKARHRAVQAYKRLNLAALRQLPAAGILFTFSCTQVVGRQLFEDTLAAAAIEAGREVRILERLSQPADHPVSVAHPEGQYLKGLVLSVT